MDNFQLDKMTGISQVISTLPIHRAGTIRNRDPTRCADKDGVGCVIYEANDCLLKTILVFSANASSLRAKLLPFR